MPPSVPGILDFSALLPLVRFIFEGHHEQFSTPRFVCDLVSCLATTGFSSADATGLPDWARALAGVIMDAAVDSGIPLASTPSICYNVAMFTASLMISSGLMPFRWGARVNRGDAPQTPIELVIAAAVRGHHAAVGLCRMPRGQWLPAIRGLPHQRPPRRRVSPATFFLADCGGFGSVSCRT
jgi:hypothetical protein